MITIIIPVYNEKENIQRLLHYLDGIVLGKAHIIVAISENNSDGSERLMVHKDVVLLKCKGRGRAIQMNEAAGLAEEGILVFLHADVFPPKNFLEDIRKTIKNGYHAGFFSYKFDSERFLLKVNGFFTSKDSVFTGGGDQCLFIKKDIFDKLGGFDEKQVLMEDFEFFQRMKKHEVRYKIIKNDLIVSARKYVDNSYLRVNLSNLLLMILFKWGYPSKKLRSLHNKLIKTPYKD